ncbi:helix-turn-helix domain-containing protein [Pleomorphomonas sp. JP5]|uniref:helix-turn-helix domain-containing protein n=1 Tax=Pleomorphomonas sp. JP5 TaxID=2942998 RepID=UPI002044CC08|nr:helix-turn-helix domain-containing protein [Pleomorphomonas sp. JP5]MCM5556296.1 helix-turn-helix domain-containing protein [Pleomorphomonas sp. JP5]
MSGPRYSIIPRGAAFDERLQGRDLQVLCVLGSHTDDGGWAIRSQVKIAAQIKCARSTVQASMKRLVDAGYVEIHYNQRRDGGDASSWYRVRLDMQATPEAEVELYVDAGACEPASDASGSDEDTPCRQVGTPAGMPAPLPTHEPAGVPIHGAAPLTRVLTGDSTIPPKAPRGARETRANEDDEEGFERFVEAWRGADEKQRFDKIGGARAAWKRLTADERRIAGDLDTIRAVVAGQRRSGRQKLMGPATYLNEKHWTQVPKVEAGGVLPVPMGAFKRHWWCRFYEFARYGSRHPNAAKAKFMAKMAEEKGIGVSVPLGELQRWEAASAGYVYVLVASPEFVAWREWFADRGFRLPRPSTVDRIWMPSARPPDEAAVGQSQEMQREGGR